MNKEFIFGLKYAYTIQKIDYIDLGGISLCVEYRM